jgi:hypothetical protein
MTAGHQHLFCFAGGQVGAAQLDRADAAAVVDGYVFNDADLFDTYMKSFEMVWEQSYPYQPDK